MSVEQAAADTGLSVEELQKRIGKSSELEKLGYGQLQGKSGGMKRDTWEEYFGTLVGEIRPVPTLDIAKHLIVSTPNPAGAKFKKNSKDDADMVFIPAGAFTMGSPQSEIVALGGPNVSFFMSEGPQHKVMLDGYYIYRTPVTVAQYLKFCEETGHPRPPAPEFNPNWSKWDHPIVNVSYDDALAYCGWAGVKLPTETINFSLSIA
jgi:formylglycine-generating enzyme required for sulfatase activity